ncbi:DDE-type integrase/transposase/recombinase [Vibrio parahaemolyticus]|uniref:DDE-type integrase/transposase/recombinase n=1 Tax=Vibrio TaxID=662 RepID=UPI00132F4F4F|nr:MULTISPECIES: DDE-type integrase/transposase/recombinase [Vibrio]MBE3698484.1 transposase family protein [Vibrio parahaemolyticus]MBE3777941.1 transposase family protein [Vibrio parahaemolyticus]MCZ6246286.1 DDE-type integrase/transposase/recombinase [Vibrio parahaemolyticus]MDE0551208.1 DDE-type integrase/transposase/recombinase [Vibrio sp. VP6]QHG93785.1 transposase [Vibrio parahaemolyticus]
MNALELERAQYLKHLMAELDGAGRGEKGSIIQRATEYLCISKNKLYQELAALGWASGRKKRNDSGELAITRTEAELLANLMRQSERDSGKRLMTIRDAIDIALANGQLSQDISESTVLRAFKRFRVHPNQLNTMETTTSQRSLYPNHAWQFDVSICVLYYLKGGKGLRVMAEDEFYKNKPKNLDRIVNERVLRYLATDHYSGAFFLRYYVAPGENTETITKFLFEAFCERNTGELMYGVPQLLIWDAGSANIAHQTRHMLDMLEVKHIAHTPGRPWAKGQVESTHNIVERRFESRLAFTTINSIEELNQYAVKWSMGFQALKAHSRHKTSRFGLWQTIRTEQLRLIKDVELVKSMMQQTKPEVRKVRPNELSISFAPKGYASLDYSLAHIPHIIAGDEVKVFVNPYKTPAIRVMSIDDMGQEHTHEALPIERDAAGFNLQAPIIGEQHKAIRETQTDISRKRLDTAAWGTDNPRDIKKVRKGRVPAFNGDINPMADIEQQSVPFFMPRRGTEMSVEGQPLTEQKMTIIGALNRFKKAFNPRKEELASVRALLKKQHPDGLTESELKTLIELWEQGGNEYAQSAIR